MYKYILLVWAFLHTTNAYGSKCAVELVVSNNSESTIRVKASITLEKETGKDFYGKKNTDIQAIGYTTSFSVKPNEDGAEQMFYFCGYEGDPTEFWINYQTSPESDLKSIFINNQTYRVFVVSGG